MKKVHKVIVIGCVILVASFLSISSVVFAADLVPTSADSVSNEKSGLDLTNIKSPTREISTSQLLDKRDAVAEAKIETLSLDQTLSVDKVNQKPVSETDKNIQPEQALSAVSSSAVGGTNNTLSAVSSQNKPTTLSNTGALTYSYDIQVPKGRNAMSPSVSLNYNSQNTQEGSIVGYGWSLSIPYIQRRNLHGTDQLYAGAYNDFTSSIHGDLVQIGTTNTYRPESMTEEYPLYTFSNNYFTYTDKSGIIYSYGVNPTSRQDDPSDATHVYTWMLEKVEDTNGNFISYTYFKDQGQIYTDTITYTNTATATGIYKIEFVRGSRVDVSNSYKGVFLSKTQYKITSIKVSVSNVLRKQYDLNYTTGNNGVRSLLFSVQEKGYSATNVLTTLPATSFEYSNYSNPIYDTSQTQTVYNLFPTDVHNGVLVGDVNGDVYPDIVKAYAWNYYQYWEDKQTDIYNPQTGLFQVNPAFQPSSGILIYGDGAYLKYDGGTRLLDVNGDLKPDLIRTNYYNTEAQIHSGTGWVQNSAWIPTVIVNPQYTIYSQDINGDGLVDYLQDEIGYSGLIWTTKQSFNNGSTFVYSTAQSGTPSTTSPFQATPIYTGGNGGSFLMDINGDNLPDIIYAYSYNNLCGTCQNIYQQAVYINTGKSWVLDTSYTLPPYFSTYHNGYNSAPVFFNVSDFNQDGLLDLQDPNGVYLNQGKSFSGSNVSIMFSNILLNNNQLQNPYLMMDIDVDGDQDYVIQANNAFPSNNYANIYYNTTPTPNDLLKKITTPTGGTYDITYKSSAQYKDASGALLNPTLPIIVQTANTITSNDQNGNVETHTYTYSDGSYYFAGPFDKKFAGFGTITDTTPTQTVKTYYHQGNTTNTTLGEYLDSKAKIGKAYRTEILSPLNQLQSVDITRWTQASAGTPLSAFVYPIYFLNRLFSGGTTSVDTGSVHSYNVSTGNVTQKINYGLVTGNNTGTFGDIGTDKYTTNYTYTSNATTKVQVPNRVTVKNQSNVIEQDTKYFYDGLASGVTKGNNTKTDTWASGTMYASSQSSYNAFGLVTSTTDPNGNNTTYTYDSNNLYPITVTAPLSTTTSYAYDYATGKPLTVTDPNGKVYTYTYDGFGRILSESIPDPATSASVLKTTYTYTDTPNTFSTKKSSYLTSANNVDSLTYMDGFGRPIQTTTEAKTGFNTTDTVYNPDGTILKQSLPYSNTVSTKVSPTTNTQLYTTYTYDTLKRPLSETNGVGVTTHAYTGFTDTVTDPNGKQKKYTTDAYGNLASIVEYLGTTPYTTAYTYNSLKNLTKITDAMGNVRNFTYDGKGQRLTSQDLHTSADTTFGTYTYVYVPNGNVTQTTTPNGKTISYTYNALNQQLTEDETSTTGADISYKYNTCTNGKGKICSSTRGSATTSYTYDTNGNIAKETSVDGIKTFVTTYTYDRQGNIIKIIFPDLSEVNYTYTLGGQPYTVSYKPSATGTSQYIVGGTSYAPHGLPSAVTLGNLVNKTYTYDPAKMYRLTNISSQKGTSPKVQDISYTYDAVGNIVTLADATATNTKKNAVYTYDDLSRLLSATITNVNTGTTPYTENYTYNILGNILTKGSTTYAYANTGTINPHAPTTIGTNTLTYDTNGNILTDGARTNTWNYRNEIQSILQGTTTYTYVYDHKGSRIKEISGANTTYTPTKTYTETTSGTSTTKTKNIYLGDMLVGIVDNTVVTYPLLDHLGSTEKVTKGTGAITETTDYYPYGTERIHTGTNSKRRYIGQVYDEDTQMSYLNARYYRGSRGQFISQDPVFRNPNGFGAEVYTSFLSDPQTQNSYSYARNNPINRSDPSGLFNSKTGAVEKRDTLSKITNILNTNNGTNYSVPQVAKLNGIKDANKITVGQILVPNGSVPDVTSSLTTLMEKNSSDWKINNPLYFRSQVKNNGPWDLKNIPEYNSKTFTDGFVFNAEKIRSDSPANIHYGYVGNAAFWGVPSILLQEAGSAQIRAGTSQPGWKNGFYGDDPRDQAEIMRGINLYRNR